jgi:hypothetical protein
MDEVIRTYGVLVTPPNERFGYSNVGMGIAAQAEGLSLRLQLRDAKLSGEIGAQIPIPRAAVPGYLPFWAELSRAQD